MWLLFAGIILLLLAAIWQTYCLVGGRASPVFAPAIFYSAVVNMSLQLSCIILFIGAIVMLFFVNWIIGLISIPFYFFVLRLISPHMHRYILGSWDENKDVLEEHGYTKDNYLDGNWWKKQPPV